MRQAHEWSQLDAISCSPLLAAIGLTRLPLAPCAPARSEKTTCIATVATIAIRSARAVWDVTVLLGVLSAGLQPLVVLAADNRAGIAPLQRSQRSQPAIRSVNGPWPQWRGPRQDGISIETGLLNAWPRGGPAEVWSTQIGLGYSSVAVVGKRLYTMDMRKTYEYVRCLDVDTGREVWNHEYQGAYKNQFGSGPRGTPTVCQGRVYSIGATGILHCLSAEDGRVLFQVDLLDKFHAKNLTWGISGSPLVHAGMVFANPGGKGGNSVVAIDAGTGETIWRGLDDKAGYATPLLVDLDGLQAVVFFTGDALVGVSASRGEELFRQPWKTRYDCNIATPIFSKGLLFTSSGYGTGCALFQLTRRGEGISARQIYQNRNMRNHFSTCVLHDGHLYGFDEAFLSCLELRTGERKWTKRGFGKGSITMADGHLFILSDKGKLCLARPSPQDYQEINSFQALAGKCWTVPVIANGRLYVRNEEILRCFDLRGT